MSEELNRKIDRVLSYLEDDSTTGRKGLFSRMEEIDSRVQSIEIQESIRKGKKSVYFFIGSIVMAVILKGAAFWEYVIQLIRND